MATLDEYDNSEGNILSNQIAFVTSNKLYHSESLEYCNGFDQRVARQQLYKHGPPHNSGGTCVFYVVTSSTIQAVFHGVRAASI
jgi:hypothetical protein